MNILSTPLFRPATVFLSAFIAFNLPFFHSAYAQAPSPAQIEQFKSLSPSEQKALAVAMGIDPSLVEGYLDGSLEESYKSPFETEVSSLRSANPRTQNDSLREIAREATDDLTLSEDDEKQHSTARLNLFGYDIFQFGADAFAPATDIPIPDGYTLGPGDNLEIQLYGKENRREKLVVNRDGQVQLSSLAPISLIGLTFEQARNVIEDAVKQQMIGVSVSITMGTLRTIRIFVLGEAQVPGSYVVSSLSSMTNAIFASGGITEIGSLRNIQLKRRGEVITTLDLYDLLLNGDTSNDSRLLPGDVIFIPTIGQTVGVSGEVKRPAIYELRGETNVNQAIQLAGGLAPKAYLPSSRIERITDSGEKTLVNLDLTTSRGKRFKLKDADIIQIVSTLDTMRDIVKLEGHVKRPGGFAWFDGIRFTDIVSSADEMLANPDIEIGLILREEDQTRKIRAWVFYPSKAFMAPNGADNPLLKSRDRIILFNYEEDRTAILADVVQQLTIQADIQEKRQVINVYGSIRFPGEYPYVENFQVNDAVKLAGGLTVNALGTEAEITRYDLDEDRNTVSLHIDINLQTSEQYLVEGDTLNVKQIPHWKQKENVQIFGEVMHPGTYTILPGETLVDLLNRAGGFTSYAYPEGAIFSREDLRRLERERLEDLKVKISGDLAASNLQESEVASVSVDEREAERIIENIEEIQALGRMVIDLSTIIDKPQTHDFSLEDGDVLEIPRYKASVTVVGEVQYPTSHFFDSKLSVHDYLDRSGGSNQNADNKRIYIVKANGRVYLPSGTAWFRARGQSVDPGDTIVVPIDTDKVDALTLWSSITRIIANVALSAATVANL